MATAPPRPWRPSRIRVSYAPWRLQVPLSRAALSPMPGRPGRFLLAGGLLAGDVSASSAYDVAPATGSVRRLPNLAVPVHDTAAGPQGRTLAVFGGGNAVEQGTIQRLAGHHWRVAGHLPTTRSDLSVVGQGRDALVLGGYDGLGQPRAVLLAGPTGTVRPVARLRVGVRYAAVAQSQGAVFLFGGEVNGAELTVVQRVDLRTHSTSVVAHLPRGLGHAAAVTIGGRILVVGGRTAPERQTARLWWFDPGTARFTPAGRLPVPTSDAELARVGRTVFVLGGEHPGNRLTDRVVELKAS